MGLNQSPTTFKYIHKRQKTKENKSLLHAAKLLSWALLPCCWHESWKHFPHTDDERKKFLHYLSDCYLNFLSYHVLRNNLFFVIFEVCERKSLHTICNKQRHFFSSPSHVCKHLNSFILRRNYSGVIVLTTAVWINAASNQLWFFPNIKYLKQRLNWLGDIA